MKTGFAEILNYNPKIWHEERAKPVNTLQLFITNRCNLRCKACFYSHKLGKSEMPFDDYKKHVRKYAKDVKKVILLGGEPTLHKDLSKMISFNDSLGLKTTVYTNGFNLKALENANLKNTQIRIGVYGSYSSEKPLAKVKTSLPVTVVYMLRKDNVKELMETADMAEKRFNCKRFYISTIRDIAITGSFWKETAETLPLTEYAKVAQEFINNYKGKMELHIAWRGVIKGKDSPPIVTKCRFGNIFPDDEIIRCPLDISKRLTTKKLEFNKHKCNKNKCCLLCKIVLKRV